MAVNILIYPEVAVQKQSSRSRRVFQHFAKVTGFHLCRSLFFNKVAGLKPKTYNFIEKETQAFLHIQRNFHDDFFFCNYDVINYFSIWIKGISFRNFLISCPIELPIRISFYVFYPI